MTDARGGRGGFQRTCADPARPQDAQDAAEPLLAGHLPQVPRHLPQFGYLRHTAFLVGGRVRQAGDVVVAASFVQQARDDVLDRFRQQSGIGRDQQPQREGPRAVAQGVGSSRGPVQQLPGAGREGTAVLGVLRQHRDAAVQHPYEAGVRGFAPQSVAVGDPFAEGEFGDDRQHGMADPLPQRCDQVAYLCPQDVVEHKRLFHGEQPALPSRPGVEP
ncbi:hypothetical protein ACFW6E_39365 [Streptomyces olivaceoviridis]|uniref:hypothetical protein n=1 Tax=Streptomyces olivaceoviridis TaxID=1921 RepID=UPI00368F557B